MANTIGGEGGVISQFPTLTLSYQLVTSSTATHKIQVLNEGVVVKEIALGHGLSPRGTGDITDPNLFSDATNWTLSYNEIIKNWNNDGITYDIVLVYTNGILTIKTFYQGFSTVLMPDVSFFINLDADELFFG